MKEDSLAKEKKKEANRKYHQNNRDKILARKRRYYEENRDQILIRKREQARSVPEKIKNRSREYSLNKLGLTLSDFEKQMEAQEGRCGICRKDVSGTTKSGRQEANVDHDHETGRFRGILCHRCNVSLGALGDSVEGLNKAICYLIGEEDEP